MWRSLILVLVFLPGCAVLAPYTQKAADAEDAALKGSLFGVCRAISVGAWVRAYGADSSKAAAWRVMCAESITELPTVK